MKRKGLIIALALLLAINLFVLAGVAMNRQGTPDASIVMTERELPLAWSWQANENSGLALALDWNRYDQEWDWFDTEKLAALGIDLDVPDDPDASYRWHRSLPVKAYVVLEYDGPAWNAFREKKHAEKAELPARVAAGKLDEEAAVRKGKEIDSALRLASRLFPVDVGKSPEPLRAAYPDRQRYLITPAEVRATINWTPHAPGEKARRTIQGHIDRVLTETIHLPRPFHRFIESLPGDERIRAYRGFYGVDDKVRPHYRVRLHYGSRYEPWVVAIEPLGKEE